MPLPEHLNRIKPKSFRDFLKVLSSLGFPVVILGLLMNDPQEVRISSLQSETRSKVQDAVSSGKASSQERVVKKEMASAPKTGDAIQTPVKEPPKPEEKFPSRLTKAEFDRLSSQEQDEYVMKYRGVPKDPPDFKRLAEAIQNKIFTLKPHGAKSVLDISRELRQAEDLTASELIELLISFARDYANQLDEVFKDIDVENTGTNLEDISRELFYILKRDLSKFSAFEALVRQYPTSREPFQALEGEAYIIRDIWDRMLYQQNEILDKSGTAILLKKGADKEKAKLDAQQLVDESRKLFRFSYSTPNLAPSERQFLQGLQRLEESISQW